MKAREERASRGEMDLTLCYALAPTLLRTTQSVTSVSIACKEEDDVLKSAVLAALRATSPSAGLYYLSTGVHDDSSVVPPFRDAVNRCRRRG